MADKQVASDVTGFLDTFGLWGPYWSDKDTAVVIYQNNSRHVLFARTTDAGANWASTTISAVDVFFVSCWYDRETPGDTGNLVHIVSLNITNNDVLYRTVDVTDGSLGTERTVDSTVTVSTVATGNRAAITKAVNGNLLIAISTQTEIECYRSTDSGANWTDRPDVFETATEGDWVLLFPADVDAGDVAALFWDRSAGEISLKMYDDSGDSGAGTWTETSILAAVADVAHINMDGSIRHSDSHLLLAFHSNDDDAGDDIQTYDLTVNSIASPTVTAKTNVMTDEAESAQVAVFINQQNDDVYVAWLSGNPTWQATTDAVYKKSTDGMGAWGTEQAYNETTDDYRLVQAGRTVGNAGGRYQPVWYDDDSTDIWVNLVNDIEFAAVVGEEAPTSGWEPLVNQPYPSSVGMVPSGPAPGLAK